MNVSNLPTRLLLIGGAALFLASFPAKADPVTIANYNFSNPNLDSGLGYNVGDVPDWNFDNPGARSGDGIINNTINPEYASVPGGSDQFAYLNVVADADYPTVSPSLTQTLTTDFIAGDNYALAVYVGNNSFSGTIGTYTLTLYDNGSAVKTADLSSALITPAEFAPLSLDYTPTDDGTIGIALSFTSTTLNVNEQGNFADVTLNYTPAVPEPSDLAYMAIGVSLFFLVRRKLMNN